MNLYFQRPEIKTKRIRKRVPAVRIVLRLDGHLRWGWTQPRRILDAPQLSAQLHSAQDTQQHTTDACADIITGFIESSSVFINIQWLISASKPLKPEMKTCHKHLALAIFKSKELIKMHKKL